MKQIAVTLLILFAQLLTSAQADDCKGVKVEVDSFTNEMTIHTENRMLTDRVNGFVGRVCLLRKCPRQESKRTFCLEDLALASCRNVDFGK